MKKIFVLLLLGLFGIQISFASTPAEDKANELRPLIKLILEKSSKRDADLITVKNIFISCQTTCQDAITREAATLILATYDQHFGITEKKENQTQTFDLVEVVDGDTIKIKDAGGKEHSVRMIGLDAPESTTMRYGYAECFGQESTAYLKSLIGSASQIQLETDETQTATDKYGRLLGYVLANGINLNQQMIEDGYAFEYTYNLPYKYQSQFKQAQKNASEQKKGLWADSACQGDRKKGVAPTTPVPEKSVVEATPTPETSVYNNAPLPLPETSAASSPSREYHRGPRGGCYYLTDNGKKEYVDRSLCSAGL